MYEALAPVADQCASVIEPGAYPRCLRYGLKDDNLDYKAIQYRLKEANEVLHIFDVVDAVCPILLPDAREEAKRVARHATYRHDEPDKFFDDIVRAYQAAETERRKERGGRRQSQKLQWRVRSMRPAFLRWSQGLWLSWKKWEET